MRGVLAGQRAVLLLLTGVELVVFLDVSIINLAMPSIGAALGMGVVALAWVSTAYQVTFGGFQLGAGRATDLLGRRLMFQIGLAVFTAASLAAGLTSTDWVLIAARAVQGVGAAILIPAELALLTALFTEPEAYRRAFGVWSAMGAVGAAGGVALGGVIVQSLGWQWVFLINIPIGVAGLVLSARLLPADGVRLRSVSRRRLDLPGMATGTGALLLLAYVVTVASEGEVRGWHGALAVAGAALAAGFVVIQRRAPEPLLPFQIFTVRAITGSTLANVIVGATHVPVFVFVSLYFQQVRGYTAMRAGFAVLPIALVSIPVARMLIPMALRKLGPRTVLAGGMALLTVALLLLARMPVGASYAADFLPAALVLAVALPAIFVGSTMPGVKAAAEHETGVVSGVINTAQRLGAGLGVAVLAAVAESRTSAAGGRGASALNSGYHAAFLGAGGLAVLGVAVALLLIPGRAAVPEGATIDAGDAGDAGDVERAGSATD